MSLSHSEIAALIADTATHAGFEGMETIFRITDTLPDSLKLPTLAMALAVLQDKITMTREVLIKRAPEIDIDIESALTRFKTKREALNAD